MHLGNKRIPIWKEIFDKIFASLALIFSLPLMLGIALVIKLTDKGPIFFKQKRIGFQGKPFYVIKFRTMYPDA
jgi:lipopolysaccharide/colanic/teichoic acid biosynthesis glycosyltransferase